MSKSRTACDVFLSHAAADEGVSAAVANAFEQQGLSVFLYERVPPSRRLSHAVSEALAECAAVVVLTTPMSVNLPSLAFEVGAGMAWRKAILVLRHGIRARDLPSYLAAYPAYTMNQVSKVVQAVRGLSHPMAEPELNRLRDLYLELSIPTDQLSRNPSALEALTTAFNQEADRKCSAEQLLREMIRRRKQGKWPRLGAKPRRSS